MCILIEKYQHLRETYCLLLRGIILKIKVKGSSEILALILLTTRLQMPELHDLDTPVPTLTLT
jgi:hypothetical protein